MGSFICAPARQKVFVWCEGCSVLGCPSSLGWLKPRSAELTHGLLTGALQLFPTAAVSLLGPAGVYCPIRQIALTAGEKGKFQTLPLLSHLLSGMGSHL